MRKIKNYYFSVTDYIPSTTLRGAILAEYYYQKGKIDQNYYVSPAYPKSSAPAHYFSPAVSRKSKLFEEEKEILQKKSAEMKEGKSLEEIMKFKSEETPKPKIGTLITLNKEENEKYLYSQYSSESTIEMHVAIDKDKATSVTNMLYAYEYKKLGEMWALSQPSEIIDVVETIRVGRGKNRGNKEIQIQKVKEVEFPESEGGLSYCLSQCVTKLFGNQILSAKSIIGDTSIYSGWFTTDEYSGQKPVFNSIKEGSLIYLDRINVDLRPAGLNFLLSIKDLHELLKVVE
ncbi:hypothetical protein B6F84_00015 [Acidianus manzaensis]|uniref:Type I-A CRISPR-associated protein Cas5 n=2 Tax=Acidianus manzaensis TaxID=282676 RepID=A0A1W6K3G5_9CREN|nr:hypothetical protein B6F84_00015 [Acidianus manzaensis]